MTDRPAPLAGAGLWSLSATTVAVCGLAIAVWGATPAGSPGLVELASDQSWLSAVFALGLAAAGHAVVRHGFAAPIGWTLAGFALFWGLDGLAEAYVGYGVHSDSSEPGTSFALWFFEQLGALLPLGIMLPFLLYPTGRFLPGRWRVASWASVAAFVLAGLAFVVRPPIRLDHPEVLPPDLRRGVTELPVPGLTGLSQVLGLVAGLSIVVPLAVVVVRHRRARGLERDRMRWLLWGVVVEVLLVVVTTLIGVDQVTPAAYAVTVLLPPVVVAIGLGRPRIVDIDALLSATLADALITLLVGCLVAAALGGLSASTSGSLSQQQVVVVALALAGLLYGPLRAGLGHRVRRLVLGSRDAPYDVVSSLASSLESVEDTEEQLGAISRAVAAAFGVTYVRVEIDRARGGRLVATHGRPPPETRVLPITYRDAEVGRLVLPVRGLRAHLTSRDEELLGDVVRQAAAAARSSQLAEELQLSRESLVLAREEERRRIRRDLHDGLGPALSGVVFRLDAANLLAATDPGATQASLTVTREHVQDVIADVRRLVHDLRPPALDDLGLVGAVRQLAERMSGPAVEVDVEGVDDLPAAVEVAAYRIVAEALTNVVRHAHADHCRVTLSLEDALLHVQVDDDGVGVDPAVSAGVGLVSLRERAAELGGRSEITCPDESGTRVNAWLPVRSDP